MVPTNSFLPLLKVGFFYKTTNLLQLVGYDEFSIVDVALEMKFKPFKKNAWNNWDDVVNWEEGA